jgi:hypothetical protein
MLGSRRSNKVNYIPGGSSSSSSFGNKRACPLDSSVLIYRSDIDNYICTVCGWSPPPKPEEQEVQDPNRPNMRNKPKEEGEEVFIMPVGSGRSRREEFIDSMQKRHFEICDEDTKLLERKYNATIVDSVEHVDDRGTFNSSSESGYTHSNRRSGTTRYFH